MGTPVRVIKLQELHIICLKLRVQVALFFCTIVFNVLTISYLSVALYSITGMYIFIKSLKAKWK